MKKLDLLGKKFSYLTVKSEAKPHFSKSGRSYRRVSVECICGKEFDILVSNLGRKGSFQSCGCKNIERSTKHGQHGTLTYNSWMAMMSRCNNPNAENYARYGGKGITVCERWHDVLNFIEDMGERPSALLSIDRIDGKKGYFKENCRWATNEEQAINRISTKVL